MAQVDSTNMVVMDRVHRSWASATTAWQQHRISSGANTSSSSELDSTMESVGDKINDAYDELVDVLGKQFVNGDNIFDSDMSDLERGLLSQLCASLKGLSSHPFHNPDSLKAQEAETKKLAVLALARNIQILELLASRLGYNKGQNLSRPPDQACFFEDLAVIDWCKGALLIQQSSANYRSTIIQPAGNQSKTCQFCYMEICDYRSRASRYTEEDWSALASCHVLACSSFQDRRAAYRCFGCYLPGISKVQASAAAMSDHIASCSEFKEKRVRTQMPAKTYRRSDYAPPSPVLTPGGDYLMSSAASTPLTSGNYSPGPRSDQSRSEKRVSPSAVPSPARNLPPVPSTSQTGPAYPPRPDPAASAQRVPGEFPNVQPRESVHSHPSPINVPTSSNQDHPQTPPGHTPTHRKGVPSLEKHAAPQSPPVNSPRPKRASWTTSSPHPRPPVPPLPAQVEQLMELGASRTEAESRLQATNWDVQEAAELYLNNTTSRRH